jgi:hypothetical protein
MAMIIFFLITASAIFALHKYLMRSIDSYDKYGAQHPFQEWRDFEKSHSVYN